MNYLKIIALFGFLGVIITSCVGIDEPEKPSNLIPEDHYVDILIEFQHIKTWRNTYPDSVNADSLKKIILDRYRITESQFEETHQYYQQNVEEQLIRIEEAIRRLESEKQYIQDHIDSVRYERRTDSILTDLPVQVLPYFQKVGSE